MQHTLETQHRLHRALRENEGNEATGQQKKIAQQSRKNKGNKKTMKRLNCTPLKQVESRTVRISLLTKVFGLVRNMSKKEPASIQWSQNSMSDETLLHIVLTKLHARRAK